MLSRGELEKNVMDKRGVDVAGCIGSAKPHSQNFALGAAPVPSVTLRDVEYALLDCRPDSTAAIAECGVAVKKRKRCRDDSFGHKAVDIAVSGENVVCAEVDHFSGD